MRTDSHEEFAARLLACAPKATYTGRHLVRDYSLAIWIARRYGYRYPDIHRGWGNSSSLTGAGHGRVLEFWRDDDPAAQRSAAWMRNPAAAPTFPPPIAWTTTGGFGGFHPPGWHPAVHLLITPEVEMELRDLDRTMAYTLDMHTWNGIPRHPEPVRPPAPLPPPPPDTITYPDGQ
ncbi:hypothetical protein [Streptacidiphilus sp. MAP5-3]|uniref:hypothetical protein n=1 Tax=unclassified Streptacidiphilus TaxID=2643834 RepID=UPI0035117D79